MTTASTSARSSRDRRDGPTPGRDLARIAALAALDKKAREVTVMDLRGISGEVDYFVIATGESDLQIKAIVEGIVQAIREQAGERPVHREGQPGTSRWIVLDYFDLAVHVFDPESRTHYDLERLWGDAPMETLEDDAEAVALLDAPPDVPPAA
ncbi:MAG: ribosome silencing factor [Bacteroidota bacterium]